ncbi:interleukin-8-like [Anguilla rostrata]
MVKRQQLHGQTLGASKLPREAEPHRPEVISAPVHQCVLRCSGEANPDTTMDCRVIASVLICLAFVSITTTGLELRCSCIKRRSEFIPRKHIHQLEIIPAGAHCERPEVIITMKGGKLNNKICVDPEARWVKTLIHSSTRKMGQKK